VTLDQGPVFHKFLTPDPNEKRIILPESTPNPVPPLIISQNMNFLISEKMRFTLRCQRWSLSGLQVGYLAGKRVCNLMRIYKNCFLTGTGYGSGYQNAFIDISRIQAFRKRCTWHSHSFIIFRSIFSAFSAMIPSLSIRDDHYPVFWLDIRRDSDFATGYEYPKTTFKVEPDMDLDIRNAFIDVSRIRTFGKSCTLHNHPFDSLSSEASFQPSVQ